MSTRVVPSCESPRWKVITIPLADTIRDMGGMNMVEMLKWGKARKYTQNFTRHLLAWLSFNDLVEYDVARGIWIAR